MPNQIPRSLEIIGAGLDSLSGNGPGVPRPAAFSFANNGAGRYADLFAGWDAQCQLVLRRFVDECASARMKSSTGPALVDLARSEFETDPDLGPTTAIGTVTLTRASGPAGVIPKGNRFKRPAQVSSVPPVPAAFYAVTQDTPVPLDATSVSVPIAATDSGSSPNFPSVYANVTLTPVDTLYDQSFVVSTYEVGGGAEAKGDAELRNEAFAFSTGQFAPTIGAAFAGALRGSGVRHAAVMDVSVAAVGGGLAAPTAYTGLLIADGSWGGGATWVSKVKQQISDPSTGFLGVGPRVIVTTPTNNLVRVLCTVMLNDAGYAAYTTDITAAIQKSLTSYFNDRPDWYTFRTAGLKATISKADPRIRTCSAVTVNTLPGDNPRTDPPASPVATLTGLIAPHYWLVQNGVSVTYVTPT